jgi:ketopantoate hydroxymethyltransferase
MEDAKLLEKLGCCISFRKIPAHLAEKVAKTFHSVIGIGAGGGVDGRYL